MKALKITVLLLFAVGTVFSQKNNVETASIAISKYQSRTEVPDEERTGYIREAKKYIDLAHDNESTSNYYKMWFIRGKVYYFLTVDKLGNASLDTDPAEKSVLSLLKAQKTDEKGRFEKETLQYLGRATALTFNEGVNAFYNKNYERALHYFNITMKSIPNNDEEILRQTGVDMGKTKRTAASTAAQTKEFDLAQKYLEELIAMSYADPTIYAEMKDIMLIKGDTAAALEALTKGRRLYEDNKGLIREELNTYIVLGKQEVLIEKLTKAIEVDPYNEQLYYNRGQVYQEKIKSEEDPAKIKELEEKVLADYNKTLEINPDYEDALFNLGVLHLDKGNVFINEANSYSYKEATKANAATEKANEQFKLALPFLERAYELDDENEELRAVLLDLYLKTENLEKYKALKNG